MLSDASHCRLVFLPPRRRFGNDAGQGGGASEIDRD